MAQVKTSALSNESESFTNIHFFKGLFGRVERDTIALGGRKNFLRTDTLIVRTCYKHLLPHFHNQCQPKVGPGGTEYDCHCAVTGTPGIGKTVFGLYLLRHFIIQRETVLYWGQDNCVYLFSFDPAVQRFFGLKETETGMAPEDEEKNGQSPKMYCGKWSVPDGSSVRWTDFLNCADEYNIIFIKDPVEGDKRVSLRAHEVSRLIYIVSHGHSLISHWNSKGHDFEFFYMPLWTKQEAEQCRQFLKPQTRNAGFDSLASLSQPEIDDRFYSFGGNIRGWVFPALWDELDSKLTEVVQQKGDNILKKSPNSRGSVVHMEIAFDKNRPILSLSPQQEDAMDESKESEENPNTFSEYQYIFGSEKILDVLNEKLLHQGQETLRLCLQNWASQDGFECVYGSLFELHCHRRLESQDGNLKLRMRIVYEDASRNNDNIYEILLPKFEGTCRYPSNDPSILEDCRYNTNKLGMYFWPISSNHPTYDSAIVVSRKDLLAHGDDQDIFGDNVGQVALLLQMTVSGATGLPRRPKHSVKQLIRKKFEAVFNKRVNGFKEKGKAYTAFVVPTECFKPFLFQDEENTTGHRASVQPKCQLVIEFPNVFTYKMRSPRARTEKPHMFEQKKGKVFHKYDHAIQQAEINF